MDHAHKIAHDANAECSGIPAHKAWKSVGKTPENAGKRRETPEKYRKTPEMP